MKSRVISFTMVGLLAAGFGVAAVAAAQTATADTQICDQYGSTTIQGGRYIVANNRWGTSSTQCINVTSTGFSVTQADGSTATNGAPKSYPSVYYGCHYGNCSASGDVLTPNGMQASNPNFNSISTSVNMSYPSTGTWDAAYDIWFNKSQPTTTTGQNDGAEVMVWLNHRGTIQPVGSKVGTASIAGATWDVWEGNIGWNVVSYVRQSSTSSLSFNVSSFFSDVVSRGYGSNSWYLTSIQAGFEPWESGVGLAVTNFSVNANGPTPTPTRTPTPTPTPTPRPTPTSTGASGTCSATYSAAGSWPGGFQAGVTVKNNGSSALNGWTVKWAFANGQTVTSLWNGTLTQSGSSETVKNAAYNGSIAGNGSTSFGFAANGSAPSSLSLTCTAP